MKIKLLIILGFLALGIGNTAAQFAEYYYHRTGDTIEQNSPIYRQAWWEWQDFRAMGLDAVIIHEGYSTWGTERLLYNYTPDTLKIVGIAGVAYNFNDPGLHKLLLYDCTDSGGFEKKVEMTRDSGDLHRHIHISGNGWWAERRHTYGLPYSEIKPCCLNLPWDTTVGLFEYYLDTPVYVVDSFYIGTSPASYVVKSAGHAMAHFECQGDSWVPCDFPAHLYRFLKPSGWQHHMCPDALLIWPIIQVDTMVPPPDVCVPLTNLQAYDVDTFGLTIAWDTFPQYTAVEICYGTADSLWGCITVRDTNAAVLHLPDPAQADYIILARAVCDSLKHDSPWSDTLRITLPRDPLACPPVEGFAVAAVDTFAAILHWEPQPGAMAYELALFHIGTVLLDTLPASSAGHHLLSLPDTAVADYAVALRSLCDTATHEAASPWSDTLRFTLPRGSGGIAPALAGRILLLPNPASGQVQITSPCGLLQVDLHNASGTLVISSPASGTTHTLSLDGLAAGSYIATVRTACGTAAKRLAIR